MFTAVYLINKMLSHSQAVFVFHNLMRNPKLVRYNRCFMNRQGRAEQEDVSETHLQMIALVRGSETKSLKKLGPLHRKYNRKVNYKKSTNTQDKIK